MQRNPSGSDSGHPTKFIEEDSTYPPPSRERSVPPPFDADHIGFHQYDPNRLSINAQAPEVVYHHSRDPSENGGFYPQNPGGSPQFHHLQFPGHQHHRSLSPTLSAESTTLGSPGIGSVIHGQGEKEVYHNEGGLPIPVQTGPQKKQGRTICGIQVLWCTIMVIIAVLIAVGLAVGLGVGLGTKKS